MTSTAELVAICRTDILMSGGRDARNRLASAPAADSESVTLQFAHQVTANDKLSIGYEDMGVWGASGQTISVERGLDGSIPAPHNQGSTVYINAKFSPGQVLRSMQAEIRSLASEPGLFVPSYHTFTSTSGRWTYELDGIDPDQVMRVEIESRSNDGEWYPVSGYTVTRSADGTAVVLLAGWDGNVRICYRSDYATIAADTEDVAAAVGVGDPTLIAVGAALRLTRGRPIRRSFTEAQGDSRRANEVPGFVTEQSDQNLERWYKQLKDAEKRRLLQRHQPRRGR